MILQLWKPMCFLFPWEILSLFMYFGLFCTKECGAKQGVETWGKNGGNNPTVGTFLEGKETPCSVCALGRAQGGGRLVQSAFLPLLLRPQELFLVLKEKKPLHPGFSPIVLWKQFLQRSLPPPAADWRGWGGVFAGLQSLTTPSSPGSIC